MGVDEHESAARKTVVVAAVVVVSTTRSTRTDQSGALIEDALRKSGHRVLWRAVVDDQIEAIRQALQDAEFQGARVVLFTGGTGLSARDVTVEALEPWFQKSIPGFGELFRSLSFDEIGPAAMLSRATAGSRGPTLAFAMPGSPSACATAMEHLILPNLAHMVHQLDKERSHTPAERAVAKASVDRKRQQSWPTAIRNLTPEPGPATEPDASSWRDRLQELGVSSDPRGPRPDLKNLRAVPMVQAILDRAGETETVVLADGTRGCLFGWPDLKRGNAQVLLALPGVPFGEVLAVHRLPARTGLVAARGQLLPGQDADLVALATEVCGSAPPETGKLLAVDETAIHFVRDGIVLEWDGAKLKPAGLTDSVVPQLLARWTR